MFASLFRIVYVNVDHLVVIKTYAEYHIAEKVDKLLEKVETAVVVVF